MLTPTARLIEEMLVSKDLMDNWDLDSAASEIP